MHLQVVMEALGVSPIGDSLLVPEALQLAVYVTCFWIKHAKPEPRAEMLWALLAGLVYGHLCREEPAEKGTRTSVEDQTAETASCKDRSS